MSEEEKDVVNAIGDLVGDINLSIDLKEEEILKIAKKLTPKWHSMDETPDHNGIYLVRCSLGGELVLPFAEYGCDYSGSETPCWTIIREILPWFINENYNKMQIIEWSEWSVELKTLYEEYLRGWQKQEADRVNEEISKLYLDQI